LRIFDAAENYRSVATGYRTDIYCSKNMLLVIQCLAYCDAANNAWFLTNVLVNIQERLKLALAWNCRIDFVKKIFMSEYVANMVCTLVRSDA